MSLLNWPDSAPRLTDGALCLRGFDPDDADAVHAACQDPAIQRFAGVPSPYTREHAAAFVGEFAPSRWAARAGGPLGVTDAGTGEILGSCGFPSVNGENLEGEVGYWVAPWARGRRVAERAVRMLAEWAFDQTGLHRIELYIEPVNVASCKVAERLGCEREGLLRSKAIVAGERRDMLLYSLLRP